MVDGLAGATTNRKRCFVVMGFGKKTDFATGRTLDLNKSYRLLIKPVVEEKGLECVRADEIPHSGSIDAVMYQELLTADVVIADLSTANPNALYELGIRHALRPRTTIVISEDKLSYPFDLNHILITSYTHLGEHLDFDEVERFRKVLGTTIEAVLRDERTDSPVYTYLSQLSPPQLGREVAEALEQTEQALEQASEAADRERVQATPSASGRQDPTLAIFMERGEQAITRSDFHGAKAMFEAALQLCRRNDADDSAIAHDPYLIQRLALATYKAKHPDEIAALREALNVLDPLRPEESNDPETLGLAGAIEKRLFDTGEGDAHLSRAIWFYGRGYYLRNDWYNGINLAYLLNVRTDTPLDSIEEEKIADLVWANRIRREVLALCERDLREITARDRHMKTRTASAGSDELKADQKDWDRQQHFWCLATKAEAHFGLGEMEAYQQTRSELQSLEHADWMMDTFNTQVGRLRALLEKYGYLLNPPWPGSAPWPTES